MDLQAAQANKSQEVMDGKQEWKEKEEPLAPELATDDRDEDGNWKEKDEAEPLAPELATTEKEEEG